MARVSRGMGHRAMMAYAGLGAEYGPDPYEGPSINPSTGTSTEPVYEGPSVNPSTGTYSGPPLAKKPAPSALTKAAPKINPWLAIAGIAVFVGVFAFSWRNVEKGAAR